jgi:DNA damage-binding protein 1
VRISDGGGNPEFLPLEDGTVEGLRTNESTIAFSNVAQRALGKDGKATYKNSSLVVQVTGSCASLLEFDEGLQTYMKIDRWEVKANAPEDPAVEIVAASINSSQVALATTGGKLVLLSVAVDRKLTVTV